MNGLKVYLKSGTTRAYVISQAIVGIFLIVNAMKDYEHVIGHQNELISNVIIGVLLMLSASIPKRWRKHLRYLPGVLIAVAGIMLMWLTKAAMVHNFSKFNPIIIYGCYGLIAFGLLQPIIDIRHYAFFTTEGIRYRVQPFKTAYVAWANVKGIVFNEGGFDLALQNGKSYPMMPYNADSTNLRHHVDQMFLAGKQKQANPTVSTGKEAPMERSSVAEI